MRALQREARDAFLVLEREVALFAVGHLVDELEQRYAQFGRLVEWLGAVAEDVTENLAQFRASGQESGAESPSTLMQAIAAAPEQAFARYEVNVFVAHETDGAPVVLETNPTYPTLFGRIEHHGVLRGGFATDHRMLRPGAVHQANGGYLMLPAAEVLTQPLLWLKLKEVLRAGQIRLENVAEQYALFPTATLTPEPIELDLKVVLVGSPQLYEMAYMLDEDVRKLFRVKAEFDWRLRWDEDAVRGYASFLSSRCETPACGISMPPRSGESSSTARGWPRAASGFPPGSSRSRGLPQKQATGRLTTEAIWCAPSMSSARSSTRSGART
jgi:predicted ATP-dependent protease